MNSYIIKQPIITEKTLALANQENVYVFLVTKEASKNQIKAAIEALFEVEVEAINTISHYRVTKRTGRKRMKTTVAATKKALVKLKAGQTIKLFDLGSTKK